MLEVPITPEVEQELTMLAARIGEAPAEIARKALLAYMEDLEDYATAVEAWKEFDPKDSIPLEQVKRELGLED